MKIRSGSLYRFSRASWILVSMCALSVAGCGTNSSSTSGIKLGIIYSLSGDQASLDENSLKGAELAADYINAHGGISGTPIALEIRDAATSPTETLKQAQELFENEKVSLIVGLSDTDLAAPVATLSQELGRIFITSGATGPVLTALGPQSTFLACFSDDSQAMAASRFARERLRARSALIAYDQGTEYARILSTSFSKSFTASGGKVSGPFSFTVGNTNTAALANELDRTNPDMVFLAAQPDEVADIIRSLRSAGFTKPIVGGDSYDSQRIYDLSSTEKAKVYFTTHTLLTASSSNPRIEEFISQYKSYYGEEPTSAFAALGYDAVRLASLAIGKAQSVEPGAIRSALESIREFPGVTGSISYGSTQHIPRKDVTIVTFDNGVPTRAR